MEKESILDIDDKKNQLYNQFIDEGRKLNFLEIKHLISNLLSDLHGEISGIGTVYVLQNDGSRKKETIDITYSQAIQEISSIFNYHTIFEDLYFEIYEGKLDECFFSDIESNKEIIKIISSRIEDFFDFKNYLNNDYTSIFPESAVNQKVFKEVILDNYVLEDSVFNEEILMTNYSKDAQRFIHALKTFFVPDLHIKYPLSKEESIIRKQSDKRISLKAPTNKEKLKSLCEFCPELITLLNKSTLTKHEKGQVIYLITGVNKEDAYKNVFTSDKRTLDETTIKNDEIDFEYLKTKLKNT